MDHTDPDADLDPQHWYEPFIHKSPRVSDPRRFYADDPDPGFDDKKCLKNYI
jgi:hypothetical protein